MSFLMPKPKPPIRDLDEKLSELLLLPHVLCARSRFTRLVNGEDFGNPLEIEGDLRDADFDDNVNKHTERYMFRKVVVQPQSTHEVVVEISHYEPLFVVGLLSGCKVGQIQITEISNDPSANPATSLLPTKSGIDAAVLNQPHPIPLSVGSITAQTPLTVAFKTLLDSEPLPEFSLFLVGLTQERFERFGMPRCLC